MTEKSIELEPGEVSVLTVSRPEKLNALDATVLDELGVALDELASDDRVRALVITGAGEKAFVAGADIGEIAALDAAAGEALSRRGQALFRRLEEAPYATLAAVNGFALGGGLELALACDVRLASENAELGLPEVTLGLIPGYAGTQRLVRLIGPGRALEMVMSGRKVKAEEAARIGLVNHVYPAGELMDEARRLAGQFARAAPLAVRKAKRLIQMAQDVPFEAGCAAEGQAFAILCTTRDKDEGTRAFLEKRKARFEGR